MGALGWGSEALVMTTSPIVQALIDGARGELLRCDLSLGFLALGQAKYLPVCGAPSDPLPSLIQRVGHVRHSSLWETAFIGKDGCNVPHAFRIMLWT